MTTEHITKTETYWCQLGFLSHDWQRIRYIKERTLICRTCKRQKDAEVLLELVGIGAGDQCNTRKCDGELERAWGRYRKCKRCGTSG